MKEIVIKFIFIVVIDTALESMLTRKKFYSNVVHLCTVRRHPPTLNLFLWKN
jgi:hypothetical protein